MPITDTNFTNKNNAFRESELQNLMKKVKETESGMNKRLAVTILAAGLGKRMNNPEMPKVLFELNGKPLIEYVLDTALKLNAEKIVPIVGHHREKVINFLNKKFPDIRIEYAIQEQQLGTGHAIMQTKKIFEDFEGEILILSGDVPLLKSETVQKLINEHFDKGNAATLLTTIFENPHNYGRIIRDSNGNFLKITEEKDTTEEEKKIKEINPAIYIINSKILFDALNKITPDNNQNEYYLTDVFSYIPRERIGSILTYDELEVTGINTLEQLNQIENILKTV
jgi:UDP-N-acetylglucosamine diphosphorylase/glucosamine-1-phosphate N-acetyltransferase